MTREDIICMAREAYGDWYPNAVPTELERFAALAAEWGAKQEREACAKVCDAEVVRLDMTGESRAAIVAGICAAAIRKRGEVKP